MRYDTPIYFQSITPGEYDESTGDYSKGAVKETKRLASVTDTGTETLKLLFGQIKQGCKTVRLQVAYTEPFDHIRIGDAVYNVEFERNLRIKQNFVVSEVQ